MTTESAQDELEVTFFSGHATVHLKGSVFNSVLEVGINEPLSLSSKEAIRHYLLRKGYSVLRELKQKKIDDDVNKRVLLACVSSNIHHSQLKGAK